MLYLSLDPSASSPLCSDYFGNRVSRFAQASTATLLFYTSYHHWNVRPLVEMGV
jgi:hypothetical protein